MPYGRLKKAPSLPRISRPEKTDPRKRRSAKGLTLLETAIAMMILAILSVAVSNLVKAGVETQMARRADLNMQSIAMNIVDDLRRDIRTADKLSVAGNTGNTLTLTNNGITISYRLNGAQLTRTENGANKSYNDTSQFNVICPQSCFTAKDFNQDPTPLPRQIQINEIQVQQNVPTSATKNIIDKAFGPANFTIRQFTFSPISAMEFQ
jgi:prepilin-type N-terminal cleavage/methylation domain-containing protein